MVDSANATGNAAVDLGSNAVEVGNELIDATPVVGHIKGGIHYACGDKRGGDASMKKASRATGVIGGAVVGTLVGGPAGTVAGAIAGGAAMDEITTGVESAIHGEFRPNGQISDWDKAINSKSSEGTTEGVIGIITTTVMDGKVGYKSA